ncbi:MAG: response regulator [Anaerolineales bacterium]|nr:response regulator [Anaerolineales bacterium]MCB9126668.1 response regulator [Ardenticatenales bacterium]MCB9171792.1 response regulator [Ardenticatenales bacterium]
MHILSLTPDLFFSTRIESTLRQAGHTAHVVEQASRDAIAASLSAQPADLAIIDISATWWPWAEALTLLRETDGALPVLAFGSHVNVDATKSALALGASRVVAKSDFVRRMVTLVERYGGEH